MSEKATTSLKRFLIELMVYAVLVAVYYLLVLHLLGPWLKHFYDSQRRFYALLALALIIGQGFLLEVLTRQLLTWIQPRTED